MVKWEVTLKKRNIWSDETELLSCLILGVIYGFADLCACVKAGQHEKGQGVAAHPK